MVLADFCCVSTAQCIQDHIYSISLSALIHASDNTTCFCRHIYFFKFRKTVLAISAIIRTILSKVSQNIFSETFMGKTVKCHFLQAFLIPLLHNSSGYRIQFLIFLIIFNKKAIGDHILPTVKQYASGRFSITPCTSCFLIIAFHIFRHIIMKHIPDIRLINSHSKCVGGNHNLATVINKIILIVPSFFIRKPCVISGCRISLLNQLLAHFFHKLPGNTVYDSTFCPVF